SSSNDIMLLATDYAAGEIAFSTGANSEAVRIDSAGNVGIGITIPTSKLDIAGALTLSSTQPVFDFNETDGPVDEKFWRWTTSIGDLYLQTKTDALGAGANVLRITRTGTTVDLIRAVATSVDVVGALTATSYGGITEANLLDKDTVITVQTALTTGLAGTDELLVSDAGVTKRMDVSVIEAYMLANLGFLTSFTETNDLSAAVTWANVPEANVPTHTGDVTGGTDLTVDPTAISGKALVTAVSGDMVLIWDGTDSAIKRADFDDFVAAGGVTIAQVAARAFGGM
ncbi:hypothetical protein LCGC14_2605770, partial [marine sediment metagenome]